MAMMRHEFDKLSNDNLKTLIRLTLGLISDAAPFSDTRQIISEIHEKISTETNQEDLQTTLINLMNLVLYWDAHKDQHGRFKLVEKHLVNDMLNRNLDEMVLDQRTRYRF